MPGFATDTRTNRSSIINQHLKTNRYLNRYGRGTHRQAIEEQRTAWDGHYIGRNDKALVSLEDLLSPEIEKVKDKTDDNLTNAADTHKHILNSKLIRRGYWGLITNYDSKKGEWDFSFTVKVGNLHQFHPKAIRQRIVAQHGLAVYEKWKATVMGDFDSLIWLKKQWHLPVPLVTSIACSPSAERLCKKMELDVRSGVCFWFRE